MKRILLLAALLLFIQFVPVSSKSNTPSQLDAIDAEIVTFMNRWNIPGGTAALVKDGKLVYARGFGNADLNTKMQPGHQFRIASLSKPVTAVAVMQLVEEKQLRLEDHVFGETGILNLPEYLSFADARIGEITVKQLLQHTAGWDRNTSAYGDPMFKPVLIADALGVSAPATSADIIRFMLDQPLDFTPGTQFAYSNLGYSILGKIIEEISGQRYEDFVRQRILEPLGITDMVLGRNLYENRAEREVRYYEEPYLKLASINGSNDLVSRTYGGFNLEEMDAHGGWVTSAPSLLKFLTAVDGFDSRPDILKPETVALMTTASPESPSYALGWCVNPRGNWWHTGALYGASSLMARTADGYSWVLLFNARPETGQYYMEMDQLMWRAIRKIDSWPDIDLFNADDYPQQQQPELEWAVFPNPSADGMFQVSFQKTGTPFEITVRDMAGRKVYTKHSAAGDKDFRMDLSGLVPGVYQIQLQDGKKIYSQTISR